MLASWLVPALSGFLIAYVSGVSAYTITALVAGLLFMIAYYIHYGITAGYDEPNPEGVKGKPVTLKTWERALCQHHRLLRYYYTMG